MSNKTTKRLIFGSVLLIINLVILLFANIGPKSNFMFKYNIISDKADKYQLFYTFKQDFGNYVMDEFYSDPSEEKTLSYTVPRDVTRLRVDVGESPAQITIKKPMITYYGQQLDVKSLIDTDSGSMNDIESINFTDDKIQIVSKGNDPYITINLNNIQYQLMDRVDKYITLAIKIVLCIIFNIVMLISVKKGSLIKELIKEIYSSRILILNLSENDFKTKFSGSYLGITWAFVQPIVIVIIYWFVFQVGFKSQPMNDFPFVLWLIAGIVPWFFFNEALLNSTNSFLEYSYLVKKVVFKISILPIVKVMSAFYVHLFFIVFANIVYIVYGYMPSVYMIQALYYSICTFVLVLGISYITSSIVIFFKDLGQIVSILLQFGMWMTPIMYSYDMIPVKFQWILKINPMYYIVEGYRDTFIRKVWFWNRYNQSIYFWAITLSIFVIGVIVFKKLKPHFADVL